MGKWSEGVRALPVNLFYLSDATEGGGMTFVAHLWKGLKSLGSLAFPRVYQIESGKSGRWYRDFGYGVKYRGIDLEDAIFLDGHNVIIALDYRHLSDASCLIDNGAKVVMIDNVLKNRGLDVEVLPRPYCAQCATYRYEYQWGNRDWSAINLSRGHPGSRLKMILASNQCSVSKHIIQMFGAHATKTSFPKSINVAAELCLRSRFVVDFKAGGHGDALYTTLECVDGGSIPILHKDWITPRGEMKPGVNCITVADSCELSSVLAARMPTHMLRTLQMGGLELLKRHAARAVAHKLLNFLQGVQDVKY